MGKSGKLCSKEDCVSMMDDNLTDQAGMYLKKVDQ
jgi:hypothetical protein